MSLKWVIWGLSLFVIFEFFVYLIPIPGVLNTEQLLLSLSNILFILFFLLGLGWVGKSSKKRPQTFVTNFMGFTGFKMFASLVYMLLVGVNFRDSLNAFLLGSMTIYFAYTILEVLIFRQLALDVDQG